MKRPTAASARKVSPENLAQLGADRLAEILVGAAETRPDLKRRLRMELAAAQGAEHLAPEIDKRIGSLETSRGKVGWRQRPTFVRDVDGLRELIADRLMALDASAAVDRLWRLMETARPISRRFKDRDGSLALVFSRAAADLGRVLARYDLRLGVTRLMEAVSAQPFSWAQWLPGLLAETSPDFAEAALHLAAERRSALPTWLTIVRQLADAARDVDAFWGTHTEEALKTPSAAVSVGLRLLAADRVDEAGAILRAAAPQCALGKEGLAAPDFDWETTWIEYLDRAGDFEAAQSVRWASFERTLSVERAKSYASRLADFDDVDAEGRAIVYVAKHPDFARALSFLMAWPALADASRMIQTRPNDVEAAPEEAEAWAAKLRRRQPAAAHLLLRKVAAAAFRRRDFKTCDRLTQEADSIVL